MSDKNPKGMFDYYNVYDVLLIEDLQENEDFVEHAIFTPNCKMIQSEHLFMYGSGEGSLKNEFDTWKNDFQKIIKSYSKDTLLVFIDCHM